ncbi:PREDICTED: uncharacterized protein LOC101292756 isoform 3 [Fragaria vesca subsp. vesca]
MFELTHVNNSGKPQDPKSKQAIASMKSKIEKMKSTKRASQLPNDLNNFEINDVYAIVLGKERRGAIRGFGIGVRPDQVPGVRMKTGSLQPSVSYIQPSFEQIMNDLDNVYIP